MEVALTLSIAIIMGALGDILFSIGMKKNGEIRFSGIKQIPSLIRDVITNPAIIFGIIAMSLYFFSYTASLSWVDVSVANPLTALSYVIATIYAVMIIREHISIYRWVGISLIILGSVLIGLSS